mmetsp:Transcript_19151/g.45682  ORF Transcript_19151/g.45682 Transcript_19151/m.45682 type:complete len:579 (-) Transcript_19151:63-1799(-)
MAFEFGNSVDIENIYRHQSTREQLCRTCARLALSRTESETARGQNSDLRVQRPSAIPPKERLHHALRSLTLLGRPSDLERPRLGVWLGVVELHCRPADLSDLLDVGPVLANDRPNFVGRDAQPQRVLRRRHRRHRRHRAARGNPRGRREAAKASKASKADRPEDRGVRLPRDRRPRLVSPQAEGDRPEGGVHRSRMALDRHHAVIALGALRELIFGELDGGSCVMPYALDRGAAPAKDNAGLALRQQKPHTSRARCLVVHHVVAPQECLLCRAEGGVRVVRGGELHEAPLAPVDSVRHPDLGTDLVAEPADVLPAAADDAARAHRRHQQPEGDLDGVAEAPERRRRQRHRRGRRRGGRPELGAVPEQRPRRGPAHPRAAAGRVLPEEPGDPLDGNAGAGQGPHDLADLVVQRAAGRDLVAAEHADLRRGLLPQRVDPLPGLADDAARLRGGDQHPDGECAVLLGGGLAELLDEPQQRPLARAEVLARPVVRADQNNPLVAAHERILDLDVRTGVRAHGLHKAPALSYDASSQGRRAQEPENDLGRCLSLAISRFTLPCVSCIQRSFHSCGLWGRSYVI